MFWAIPSRSLSCTWPVSYTHLGLFLDAGETAIMANAQDFIFWNSVFYIPLAVLIIYRYTCLLYTSRCV